MVLQFDRKLAMNLTCKASKPKFIHTGRTICLAQPVRRLKDDDDDDAQAHEQVVDKRNVHLCNKSRAEGARGYPESVKNTIMHKRYGKVASCGSLPLHLALVLARCVVDVEAREEVLDNGLAHNLEHLRQQHTHWQSWGINAGKQLASSGASNIQFNSMKLPRSFK